MLNRASGILLHISSLPSSFGIGDLGPSAYRFVDLLSESKQTLWQILPLNPTDGVFHHSPYSSPSAFAGNELFISPELLAEDGFIEKRSIEASFHFPEGGVHYDLVEKYKSTLLLAAFESFQKERKWQDEFDKFCFENDDWLHDYALFQAIKIKFQNELWSYWPKDIRDRAPEAIGKIENEFALEIKRSKFFQYVFFKQWHALKDYCRSRNVKLIGDIPIYVNDDSADVWSDPQYFKLDEDKLPHVVAGVPPDYFSATGQRWGNPVYNWDELKKDGYSWWLKRLKHNFNLFDVVRIDHFRGFIEYWEIPREEKTALKGAWAKVPTDDFLGAVLKEFPSLPIIAEDLGIITDDVKASMQRYGFPGMKILLFAFDGDMKIHSYIPENYKENCVVYTGTHDNNTVRGWYENDISKDAKANLQKYLGASYKVDQLHWLLIEKAMFSKAVFAIFPLQDILGLGQEARMNTPSTVKGNWQWRVSHKELKDISLERLKELTVKYLRSS